MKINTQQGSKEFAIETVLFSIRHKTRTHLKQPYPFPLLLRSLRSLSISLFNSKMSTKNITTVTRKLDSLFPQFQRNVFREIISFLFKTVIKGGIPAVTLLKYSETTDTS